MIKISDYFLSMNKLHVSYSELCHYFYLAKGTLSGWINETIARPSIHPEDIFRSTENCRKERLKMEGEDFIQLLIKNMDDGRVSSGEKKSLLDYCETHHYEEALKHVINLAYSNTCLAPEELKLEYDPQSKKRHVIGIGRDDVVGVMEDGRVISTAVNSRGEFNTSGWKDIVGVSFGHRFLLGLTEKGRCVHTGKLNVDVLVKLNEWKRLTSVDCGVNHFIGLMDDGLVAACGNDGNGQCQLSHWYNIDQISAGLDHSVGLRSDHTVIAMGANQYRQVSDVKSWENIVQITANGNHTVGVTADGHVLTAGDTNEFILKQNLKWDNIIAVATGMYHIVGLRSDNTVVAAGFNASNQCEVYDWQDIVAIFADYDKTIGIQRDGRVVMTQSKYQQSWQTINVQSWRLFKGKADINYEGRLPFLKELRDRVEQICNTMTEFIGAHQRYQIVMEENRLEGDKYAALLDSLLESAFSQSHEIYLMHDHSNASPFFSEYIIRIITLFLDYYHSVKPVSDGPLNLRPCLTLADDNLLVDFMMYSNMLLHEINQRLG